MMPYITVIRERAARRIRRSAWDLFLIPCYVIPWFLLVFASVIALGNLYAVRHPGIQFRVLPDTFGAIFMGIGSLFTWFGPSMIIANLLVSAVPAARRALDREAAGVPGSDRAAANRGLVQLSLLLTPVGAVIAFLGAVLT
jgi:hypothetical protein